MADWGHVLRLRAGDELWTRSGHWRAAEICAVASDEELAAAIREGRLARPLDLPRPVPRAAG